MRVDLELADSITLTNSGIDGATATQVGADPVWEDDDDGTYVEIEGAYFNDGSIFHSRAVVSVANQTLSGLSPSNPDFKCYMSVRMSGVQSGLGFPQFQIRQEGGSAVPALNPTTTPTTPDSPEWVTVEMAGGEDVLWTTPSAYELQVQSAIMAPGGSFLTIRTWRIYEVQIYFEIPTRAPHPLRHYPRDDNLAGHVRRYPGTSFQRTRRRAAGGYR